MAVDFPKYRKFYVTLTGLAVLVAGQLLGLDFNADVGDASVDVYDSVVVLLTALGVRQTPNAP